MFFLFFVAAASIRTRRPNGYRDRTDVRLCLGGEQELPKHGWKPRFFPTFSYELRDRRRVGLRRGKMAWEPSRPNSPFFLNWPCSLCQEARAQIGALGDRTNEYLLP